tara:strand:+ start:155 stop:562 length:408 start_codon:yes stop_codon:yes gene_type:complete
MTDSQINEKGALDYIKAARTLTDHFAEHNAFGPLSHCQGQAIEIALKVCIGKRGGEIPRGRDGHDLQRLLAKCPDIVLSANERNILEWLNKEYIGSGELSYPSRYRPNAGRVLLRPGQVDIESLMEAILQRQDPS